MTHDDLHEPSTLPVPDGGYRTSDRFTMLPPPPRANVGGRGLRLPVHAPPTAFEEAWRRAATRWGLEQRREATLTAKREPAASRAPLSRPAGS